MQNQKNAIKLSILVPVYNVSAYLSECLESLLPQLNDQTELILMNDCSTDNSLDILNDFAKNNPEQNIKVLSAEKNSGLSETRNKMLKYATGEYVWFFDSDDVVCHNIITYFLQNYYPKNADIYIFDFIFYYKEELGFFKKGKFNEEICEEYKRAFLVYPNILYENKQFLFFKKLINTNYNFVWNKILKYDLARKLNFESGVKFEDIYYYSDMSFLLNNFMYINQPIIKYRIRLGSISNNFNEKYLQDYLNAYLYRIQVAKKHQVDILDKNFYYYLIYKVYKYYIGMLVGLDKNERRLENNTELLVYTYKNFNDKFQVLYQQILGNMGFFRNLSLRRSYKKLLAIEQKYSNFLIKK